MAQKPVAAFSTTGTCEEYGENSAKRQARQMPEVQDIYRSIECNAKMNINVYFSQSVTQPLSSTKLTLFLR